MSNLKLCSSLFVLTAMLAACGNSNSGSGPVGGSKGTGGGPISTDSVGTFSAEKQYQLDDYEHWPEELKSNDGCEGVPTEEQGIVRFDPRLKVGDSQTISFYSSVNGHELSSQSDIKVTLIRQDPGTHQAIEVTTANTLSNIRVTGASVPASIPTSIQAIETCSLNTAKPEEHAMCKTTYVNWQPPQGGRDVTMSCDYQSGSDTSARTGTISIGKYVLKSGQTVKAVRIQSKSVSKAKCTDTNGNASDYGDGTTEEVMIYTSDVVSTHASSCGVKQSVFNSRKFVSKDGRLISSMKSETLSTTVR